MIIEVLKVKTIQSLLVTQFEKKSIGGLTKLFFRVNLRGNLKGKNVQRLLVTLNALIHFF